eukprot:557983_1
MGASIIDNECYALDTLSPFTTSGYIQTFARCCDFTDYPSTIKYYASNDSAAFQSCESPSETLLGCTAYYEIIDDNSSIPDAITDPYCIYGVSSEDHCCQARCGSCTGSGCSSRPGGSANCCGSDVNDEPTCDTKLAPCMFDRYFYTRPYFGARTCTAHIGPIMGLTTRDAAYSGAICSDSSNIQCVSVWGDSSANGHDTVTSNASCPDQWFMTSCVAFSMESIIESYYIDDNDVCVVINDRDPSASAVYALATCCVINNHQFAEEVSHFHASPSNLNLDQGRSYCNDICHSNLASIHSEDEMKYAQYLAYNSPQFESDVWGNVRIGLVKQTTAHQFVWRDGSPFDYGLSNLTFNYAQGAFPWTDSKPDSLAISDSSTCVTMLAASEYRWADLSCSQRERTLCNSCDGELIKYAVIAFDLNKDYSGAEAYCKQYLGTNLASIHNQYDFDLGQKLCALTALSRTLECWIGLRSSSTILEWTDGTSFNFGTDFDDKSVWSSTGGNRFEANRCYQYDGAGDIYAWQIDECPEHDEAAICAMPSLLCYDKYWDVASGSGQYSWMDCELHLDDNVAIGNQQWMNYNGKFVLEFIFKFESGSYANGTAGIMILYDEYDWYYIAMIPSTNQVQIWKRWMDQYYIVNSMPFTMDYAYQTIHVTALNRTHFTVTINNEVSLEYLDTRRDDELTIFSGFIGVRSENASIDGRYLYVSGSIYPVNNTDIVNKFRDKYTFALPVYGINITLKLNITSIDDEVLEVLEAYVSELGNITIDCEEEAHILSNVENGITTFIVVIGTCDVESQRQLMINHDDTITLDSVDVDVAVTAINKIYESEVTEPPNTSTSEDVGDDYDDDDGNEISDHIWMAIAIGLGVCLLVLLVCLIKRKKTRQHRHKDEQNLVLAQSPSNDTDNKRQWKTIADEINEKGVRVQPNPKLEKEEPEFNTILSNELYIVPADAQGPVGKDGMVQMVENKEEGGKDGEKEANEDMYTQKD